MRSQPVILHAPEQHWECPSCGVQHVTREARPHTPMHRCGKHAGLDMPFARVYGSAQQLRRGEAAHRVVERGDYLNGDRGVPMVGGVAVMVVQTERNEGYDCHVFAPVASVRAGDL
jgi:hypothetical protein